MDNRTRQSIGDSRISVVVAFISEAYERLRFVEGTEDELKELEKVRTSLINRFKMARIGCVVPPENPTELPKDMTPPPPLKKGY